MGSGLGLFIPVFFLGAVGLLYAEVGRPSHSKALEQLTITSKKAQSLDFTGIFLFQSASLTQPFLLSQVSGNPGKSKISAIDGPAFDVLLEGRSRSIHSLNKHLRVPAIQYDALLWSSISLSEELTNHYHISINGQERVCSRITDIVEIKSIAADTYSLKLYLDQTTGSILRKVVIDNAAAQVLESYSFVEWQSSLSKVSPTSTLPLIESYRKSTEQKQPSVAENILTFHWLPGGFSPVAVDQQDPDDVVYQFSDGIFNITVFVESEDGSGSSCRGRENQHGSFSGYCQSVLINKKAYNVIVTGNVPVQTVKKIAENLKPNVL